MKYRLKDLCSITKGATGIMKADGGKYPLVALSDERRSHSEYQF
jgi:type I restriction enzyme S subunit